MIKLKLREDEFLAERVDRLFLKKNGNVNVYTHVRQYRYADGKSDYYKMVNFGEYGETDVFVTEISAQEFEEICAQNHHDQVKYE